MFEIESLANKNYILTIRMESDRNSRFSHAQSQSQGSKIRSQDGDENQRKN